MRCELMISALLKTIAVRVMDNFILILGLIFKGTESAVNWVDEI